MLNPRFKEDGRLAARWQAGRRVTRIGGLAMVAGLVAGGLSAAVSAPAALGATHTAKINPKTVNVKTAPLSLLRKLAWNDWMGHSLSHHQATSVNTKAVPLLMSPDVRPDTVVYGQDVSAFQGNVNWSANKSAGSEFAYIKATEGTYYKNPYFAQQYDGSYDVGMVRGAYAFGNPAYSSGTSQADYLASNGGAWSADGKTLPGMLDIEYNPYSGNECYNLSASAMRSWISAFISEYHKRTSRWAVIYSTTNWWDTCTGSWSGPWKNSPYFVANYSSSAGPLPPGVPTWTIWQFADSGAFAGDQDVFNGSDARLVALAKNT